MGMIGSAYGGPQNFGDILSIIGGTLKDASPGNSGNLDAARQFITQRAMYQRQQQLLSQIPGLFGGQAAAAQATEPPMAAVPPQNDPSADPNAPPALAPSPAAPAAPAPAASAPDWNRIAAAAPILKAAAGIDLTPSIDALKAGQAHLIFGPDGTAINDKDASLANKVFPKTGDNQIILRDAHGNPTGVMNLPGAASAAGETAGATANAQEAAKAAYDLVPVPQSDGSTRLMSRSAFLGATLPQAAQLGPAATGAPGVNGGGIPQVGGGAPAVGPAAQFGVSQTPAAAELAKARATTQGKNETDVAGARAAMQQVDDQTNMIAQNLHDMLGETQDPNTGKWVKTKPSMISGLSTGSGTDVIEHVPFLNQGAKDLEAKIETVRNGTSFNSLQAIKNALSAAGDGGSGSIRMTDQTARMLGEINGSLNQDQSGPQFEATVRRHLAQLDALNSARHDLYASQYQGIRPTTPGQTGPTANYNKPATPTARLRAPIPNPGDVVRGYRFLGGNPANPQSWAKS